MVIIFCEIKKKTIIVSYELRNKLAPRTVPSHKAKEKVRLGANTVNTEMHSQQKKSDHAQRHYLLAFLFYVHVEIKQLND